jgi:Spy/CpxP family protein refolding chaperone
MMIYTTTRRFFTLGATALVLASLTVSAFAGPPAGRLGAEAGQGRMKSVLASLNLTPAQKAQMRSIQKADKPQIKAIMTNTSLTAEQKRAEAMPIRKAERKQMLGILTPSQKATLKSEMQAMRRSRRSSQTLPHH